MSRNRFAPLALALMLVTGCTPLTTSSTASSSPTERPTEVLLTPTRTIAPTRTTRPTSTPTSLPTETPLPSLTPTLGPPITRTPAPPAECPKPSGQTPTIAFSENMDEMEQQFIAYLSARGSAVGLEETLNQLTLPAPALQIKSRVITADVTGDTTADVVMDLVVFDVFGNGTLLVLECNEGQYVSRRLGEFRADPLDSEPGVRIVQDMNQDGVPEIVYAFIDNAGTAGFTREFRVLEWDGADFVNLVIGSRYEGSGLVPCECAVVYDGDGEVRDTNGDGYLELAITRGLPTQYWIWDVPPRESTDVYGWNGVAFTLARTENGPPVYRLHAIWDADEASRLGQFSEALALYQRAIFDETLSGWWRILRAPPDNYDPWPPPHPDERAVLSAYSRYRIMLLHVVQGNLGAAGTVYDTLRSKLPPGAVGHQYAELARVFWEEYSGSQDVAAACDQAIHLTRDAQAALTVAFSAFNEGIPGWGWDELRSAVLQDILAPIEPWGTQFTDPDAPEDICPFN